MLRFSFFQILSFILLFFPIKGMQAQEEAFLDAYFQCTVEAHSEKGIDLKARVEKIESSLLEKGILSSTRAKAYYKVAEKLADSEEFPWDRTEIDMGGLDTLDSPIAKDCYKKLIKSYDLEENKYKEIGQRIKKKKKENDLTHTEAAEALTSVLDPKDFEHPAFRMMVLALIFDTPA